MLVQPITFTNFDGQEVTKNYYFNLTEGELAIRELESDGTWSETLERIKNSNKGSVVMPEFKKILKWTYLERTGEDGIDKSDAAWSRFENSEPWSNLIMRLITEDGFSAQFIEAIMPERIRKRNKEREATPGFRPGADTARPTPPGAHAAIQSPADVPVQSAAEADPEYQDYLRRKAAAAARPAPTLENFNETPADQPYNLQPGEFPVQVAEDGGRSASFGSFVDAVESQREAGVQHTSTPRTDIQP